MLSEVKREEKINKIDDATQTDIAL